MEHRAPNYTKYEKLLAQLDAGRMLELTLSGLRATMRALSTTRRSQAAS
jgi:hypothetical protein